MKTKSDATRLIEILKGTFIKSDKIIKYDNNIINNDKNLSELNIKELNYGVGQHPIDKMSDSFYQKNIKNNKNDKNYIALK